MPKAAPQVRVAVTFTHTRRFPTAVRVISSPTVAAVTLAAESALKELIERVPSVSVPERETELDRFESRFRPLTRIVAALVVILALAGCRSSSPLNGPAAGSSPAPSLPPTPPIPAFVPLVREVSASAAPVEPVGFTLTSYDVRTNLLGHVEFRFNTQTFWKGWEIQQSDDGLFWQSFARSVATNGLWESTNFVVVNGSPGIYPARKYRLLRIQ